MFVVNRQISITPNCPTRISFQGLHRSRNGTFRTMRSTSLTRRFMSPSPTRDCDSGFVAASAPSPAQYYGPAGEGSALDHRRAQPPATFFPSTHGGGFGSLPPEGGTGTVERCVCIWLAS